jgi:tRNA (guanine37-N1)-methyltransferase
MGLAAKVPLKDAEKTRRTLLQQGLVDLSRKPLVVDGHVLIPITTDVENFETVDSALPERKRREDLKTRLSGTLAPEELDMLKTALDIVGDIAVMEIDEELRSREKDIAEALLEVLPAVKTVVRKHGAHQGELRLQDYKHLAGEKRFNTTVVESGVRLTLDIRKTYYSVRSSTERRRIASLVSAGERVLVMFSGIAPFPCVIAKLAEPSEVVGVELNSEAHKYAKINVEQNKLQEKIKLVQGDVREAVPLLGSFDRIAMPLPHTAEDFLDVAVPAASKGAMLHLYHFSSEEDVGELAQQIPTKLLALGRKGAVSNLQRCGNLAPGINRWSLDIKLE